MRQRFALDMNDGSLHFLNQEFSRADTSRVQVTDVRWKDPRLRLGGVVDRPFDSHS